MFTCGKRLTIDQEHQNANMLYCNETCKRLHNSIAPIATCAYCGKEGSDVNNECNKCHAVKYCNAACKKKHRKKHKKVCDRIVSDGLANSNVISEEISEWTTAAEEFKRWASKDDEEMKMREEEEKEEEKDTSPSSPSLSDTNGGKTIEELITSNRLLMQDIKSRGDNPKWSNKLLMKAMGIEEETPPPAISRERREEEDTSSSPSSSSSNINAVLDKDKMIRLFDSITINDDSIFLLKDALFDILNNDDPFVLSADQQNVEQEDFGRINDECLFNLHPRQDDCRICSSRLPYPSSEKVYMSCCGKVICNLCDHELRKENPTFCLLCETQIPDSDEEIIKRYMKRILLDDDQLALCSVGCFYQSGKFGLPQSYSKALELYYLAFNIGSVEACCNIADAYDRGLGVERDYEKAWHYYELAAMGTYRRPGSLRATYNLGTSEMLVSNTERALKHFMIAVRYGCVDSLNKVKLMYRDGYATKEDYTNALRYYQAYGDYRDYNRLSSKAREAVGALAEKLPDGVKEEDIKLVMTEAGCSRRQAIMALVETDSDLVEAIVSLTYDETGGVHDEKDQSTTEETALARGSIGNGKSQTAPRKVEEKSEKDQPTIEAAAPQQINEERHPTREEEEIIQLLINQTGGSREEMVKFLTDKGAFEPRQPAPQPAPQHVQEELPDEVKQDDIRLVMSEAGVSRNRAIKALVENDDLVDAIFSLTT